MVIYTIYQITNLINNKIYIGAHATSNINDDYMSSSKSVKSAIKKYGKENFIKEIICMCENEKEMYLKEAEIVNKAFVQRSDTYNIKQGGIGGWTHWNNGSDLHKETCRKASASVKNRHDLSQYTENKFKKGDQKYLKAIEAKKELWKKDPTRVEKFKQTMKTVNHMLSKCWCVEIGQTDWNKRKVFPKDNIPDGWIPITVARDMKKRKNGVYNKMWIHNPVLKENRYINKFDDIPDGWIKGRKMEYYN